MVTSLNSTGLFCVVDVVVDGARDVVVGTVFATVTRSRSRVVETAAKVTATRTATAPVTPIIRRRRARRWTPLKGGIGASLGSSDAAASRRRSSRFVMILPRLPD